MFGDSNINRRIINPGRITMVFPIGGEITDSTATAFERWLKPGAAEILIDSGGGDFYAGSRIFALIAGHGNVTATVCSMAGSAAAYFTLAARTVRMYPSAQLMVHGATLYTQGGTEADLQRQLATIQAANATMARALHDKTGQSDQTVARWLSTDTFFSAAEAKSIGLCDVVVAVKSPAKYRVWPTTHRRALPDSYPSVVAAQTDMALRGLPFNECRVVAWIGNQWEVCPTQNLPIASTTPITK